MSVILTWMYYQCLFKIYQMCFLTVYMGVRIMCIRELESRLSLSLSTCSLKTSAGRKAVASIVVMSRGIHGRR